MGDIYRVQFYSKILYISVLWSFSFSLLWTLYWPLPSLPTTVCTLHPTYTFHTLNRTIRSIMQDVLRFANNYTTSKIVKGLGFRNSILSLYFLLLIYYRVLTDYRTKGKSALQTIIKQSWQGALLFVYFVIETIFIFGDGLTRLLLRWEKSAQLLSCSWICWAEAREGCRVGFEPRAAIQQPGALTT